MNENEMVDVIDKHEKLVKEDENRAFADFKIAVSTMKQEIEIKKVK
jgi:hypothetical protein